MGNSSIPGAFLVEGDRGVSALLESPFFVSRKVFLESGRHPSILDRCHALGIPCEEITRESMLALGRPDHLRGACAVAERPEPGEPDNDFLTGAKRLLVPVDFSDGGNLGPLIRTACAFGLDGVVVESGRGIDVFSPKCLRSSALALFRVPVFVVPHLGRTLERLSEAGFILLGVGSGGNSLSLPEAKGSRRTAVLFGGEEKGLPPEIEGYCDQLLHVPVLPGASLNAAAGGAIVLYELFGRSRTGLSQGL